MLMGVVQMGVVQLGVVQLGVVQLRVLQLGVVQMGVDPVSAVCIQKPPLTHTQTQLNTQTPFQTHPGT